MVPSFLTPVWIQTLTGALTVVDMVSSALSKTIMTGLLVLIASKPQIGSRVALEVTPLAFPPKPPPISVTNTLILLTGMLSSFETSLRTPKGA
jgi:hypothetical protein